MGPRSWRSCWTLARLDIDGSMVNSLLMRWIPVHPEWVSSRRGPSIRSGSRQDCFGGQEESPASIRDSSRPAMSHPRHFQETSVLPQLGGQWPVVVNWVNFFYDRVLGREDPFPTKKLSTWLSLRSPWSSTGEEAYDKEHLEHATFVLPSSEEVEIHRAIGETSLLLGSPKICRWLEEKDFSPRTPVLILFCPEAP